MLKGSTFSELFCRMKKRSGGYEAKNKDGSIGFVSNIFMLNKKTWNLMAIHELKWLAINWMMNPIFTWAMKKTLVGCLI